MGCTNEHGTFHHRHVELCSVGGLAILFFAYFHILNIPVPDFKPDFSDTEFVEYGRRDWYGFYAFSTKQATSPITYESTSTPPSLIAATHG